MENWAKSNECSDCQVTFTTFNRRSHCRKCCKSFCSAHLAIRRPDLPEEKHAKMCVPCLLTLPPVMLPGVTKTNAPQRVLIPLPMSDFDPTECAVPWRYLDRAGHKVTFATPTGGAAVADPFMMTGSGLGMMGGVLRADQNGREAYEELENSHAFCNPIRYPDIDCSEFDALVLPGGHAKGVREYLESREIQNVVVEFFARGAPVGAISQGVLLAARSGDPTNNKSVLHGRKTTALRKDQEMTSFQVTRLFLNDYYRTYDTPVEIEVRKFLADAEGDWDAGHLPISRDSPTSIGSGFTVRDGNYLSARWAGDAHKFAIEFLGLLDEASGVVPPKSNNSYSSTNPMLSGPVPGKDEDWD